MYLLYDAFARYQINRFAWDKDGWPGWRRVRWMLAKSEVYKASRRSHLTWHIRPIEQRTALATICNAIDGCSQSLTKFCTRTWLALRRTLSFVRHSHAFCLEFAHLSAYLTDFVDDSTSKGTIFFAMGTMGSFQKAPRELIDAFLTVFHWRAGGMRQGNQ